MIFRPPLPPLSLSHSCNHQYGHHILGYPQPHSRRGRHMWMAPATRVSRRGAIPDQSQRWIERGGPKGRQREGLDSAKLIIDPDAGAKRISRSFGLCLEVWGRFWRINLPLVSRLIPLCHTILLFCAKISHLKDLHNPLLSSLISIVTQ